MRVKKDIVIVKESLINTLLKFNMGSGGIRQASLIGGFGLV
tara:strand:- start:2480 stop:2602 length:123 start_codon:yes stop_codon:yes gene_type:complete